ncbi:MAG: PqqD family peptide modification chaperone [Anaerolineae bacterium]|nr:PqqD family peptide modification chaperone [Anaerolineae bacterium]
MNFDTPTPIPGLIWRTMDQETVLIQPQTGHYVIINEVGSYIWQQMSQAYSVKEIERLLVETYGITIEQAAADLHTFLMELQKKGLIRDEN